MTQTKQTTKKPVTKTALFGKINYLNRKINKQKNNINMLVQVNKELQYKLTKIPSIIKFIFGIKNN